jgi:hypothetical protein
MKQTAVEWLVDNLSGHDLLNTRTDNSIRNLNNMIKIEELIDQAKEMEKEQMRYFIQVGYYAHSQGHKKDDELYNYWIDNYNRE